MSTHTAQVVSATQFLTVAFGTPIDIPLVLPKPGPIGGELLTVGWTAKYGTTYLPFDPHSEVVQ